MGGATEPTRAAGAGEPQAARSSAAARAAAEIDREALMGRSLMGGWRRSGRDPIAQAPRRPSALSGEMASDAAGARARPDRGRP